MDSAEIAVAGMIYVFMVRFDVGKVSPLLVGLNICKAGLYVKQIRSQIRSQLSIMASVHLTGTVTAFDALPPSVFVICPFLIWIV